MIPKIFFFFCVPAIAFPIISSYNIEQLQKMNGGSCDMELDYDPLWDESGDLRQGCTVREATAPESASMSTVWAIRPAGCSMAQTGRRLRTNPSAACATAITVS